MRTIAVIIIPPCRLDSGFPPPFFNSMCILCSVSTMCGDFRLPPSSFSVSMPIAEGLYSIRTRLHLEYMKLVFVMERHST